MPRKLEIVVRAESLPGVVSRAKLRREEMASLGQLLKQLACDPTRTGVLLLLHEDGDVSVGSKGTGGKAGHA